MKVLLLSFLFITCACKVQMVPAANAELKAQVENAAKMTDALYLEMIASSDKQYVVFAARYASVEAEINSLVLKNQYRLHAASFQKMIATVQEQFLKYEADHKNKGVLNAGELTLYNSYMAAFWQPLIESENLLK